MHNYIWTETTYTYIYIYPFIYIHAHDMNIIKCLLRFGEITSSDYQWRQWLISGTVPVSAPFAWHRPVMPCRRPAMRQFWVMIQIVLDNRSGKGTDHTYSEFALASYCTYGINTKMNEYVKVTYGCLLLVYDVCSGTILMAWCMWRIMDPESLQDHFGTLAGYWSVKHVERHLRAQMELNWRTHLLMILDRCVLVVDMVSQQQIYQSISGVECRFASNMKINL